MSTWKSYIGAIVCLIVLAGAANAQVKLPRPSQKATAMQTIGVTDVTITYSRPGVKGRKIWGDPTAEHGPRTI